MEEDVVFPEDLTEGEDVDDEEDGAKDRTLGDARSDRGGTGAVGTDFDEL